MLRYKKGLICILSAGIICGGFACQKATTAPVVSGVASLTIVNAIPDNGSIIPIVDTSSAIMWFGSANFIPYGSFSEYSPVAGNNTVYVVQDNSDTVNVGPKATGFMYDNILKLDKTGIYSLFLCGADTSSPDYLFTTDVLPYYLPFDSVMGIRFVNISAGSNPISINLEGSANGSEVGSLAYKGITGFKQYACNSTSVGYLFVVRDVTTGDSLTQFAFNVGNNGYGLLDPNFGDLLTFKNITIAIYGSETNVNFPLSTMEIEEY